MNVITLYLANKYKAESYQCIEHDIYEKCGNYVICLSFVQEPEFGKV